MPTGCASKVRESVLDVARKAGEPVSLRHVCVACADAVDASGTALALYGRRGDMIGALFATDARCAELEELQSTLGEGPTVAAGKGNAPVLVPDLSAATVVQRWPVFAVEAAERGVAAVFAFPMQAGAAGVGVLDIYRDVSQPLDRDELADALAFAQTGLDIALDLRGGFGDGGAVGAGRGYEVHQATGMLTVQLGINATDALARLRAYSYAHGRRLSEVAADVVARRLSFAPQHDFRNHAEREEDGTDDSDNRTEGEVAGE